VVVVCIAWSVASMVSSDQSATDFVEGRTRSFDLSRIKSLEITYLWTNATENLPGWARLVTARYAPPMYYQGVYDLEARPDGRSGLSGATENQVASCEFPSLLEMYDGKAWTILRNGTVEFHSAYAQTPFGWARNALLAWGYADWSAPAKRTGLADLNAGRATASWVQSGDKRTVRWTKANGFTAVYCVDGSGPEAKAKDLCSAVDLRDRDDRLVCRWEYEGWRVQHGIWYAAKAVRKDNDVGGQQPRAREAFVVLHLRVNEDIPRDLFQVGIPAGARVRDYRFDPAMDYPYDPDLTEDQLLEMSRQRVLELKLQGQR